MASVFMTSVYPPLRIAINTAGLLSALLVVLVMACLRRYLPALVNRVSLRLQWAIACVDILKHVLLYVVTLDTSPELCFVIGFLMCFLDQAYFMLNVSIVANMQLMFLHDRFPQPSWELRYWMGSFGFAAVITFPPLGKTSPRS